MKFLSLYALLIASTLAQTSSDKVNQDMEQVSKDKQALHETESWKALDADKSKWREVLKQDKEALKGNADFEAYQAARKDLRQAERAANLTRSIIQGMKNGTVATSGNADVDAKFKAVSEKEKALAASNTAFARLLQDKQAKKDALKADFEKVKNEDAFKRLQTDRDGLKADAQAGNVNLPSYGPGSGYGYGQGTESAPTAAETNILSGDYRSGPSTGALLWTSLAVVLFMA